MKYFADCGDLQSLKKTYRKLCMKLHPDMQGGNAEFFKEMDKEYKQLLKTFSNAANFANDTENNDSEFHNWKEDRFAEIIQKIIFYSGMDIEIIGEWIWCFNAYSYKEQLKDLGFWFSKGKKAWVYNGASKRLCRGHYSKKQLYSKYGCEKVETLKEKLLK